MTIRTVCLLGGSGFLGRHVAHRLSAAGIEVRIPTRNRELAKDTLITLPTSEVIAGDIHDTNFLRRARMSPGPSRRSAAGRSCGPGSRPTTAT